jgi:DNA repair exonuclease SbcCD nuclease subunit
MMEAIKLIWRTDVHLADKTPRRRTGSWTSDVIAKLKWIGELATSISADGVIDGGDFFDVKSPTKNSHSLVREAFHAHEDYPCPIYGLVGNHDVKYGKYEYLPEQPLGVLFSSGLFTEFGDDREIIFQKEGAPKVRLVGVPYHGTTYDMERLKALKKKDEDYLIVACHLLARQGQTGSMFESEDIVGYDFLNQIPDVDCWAFGHWHKDQGITTLSNGSKVINVGSLTRGSLHLDDLDRAPCVVEIKIDSEGLSCVRHNVPIRPAQEAFKIEEAVREKEDKQRMEEIVERMKSVASSGWSELTLKERVMALKASNGAKEQALEYLERVEK